MNTVDLRLTISSTMVWLAFLSADWLAIFSRLSPAPAGTGAAAFPWVLVALLLALLAVLWLCMRQDRAGGQRAWPVAAAVGLGWSGVLLSAAQPAPALALLLVGTASGISLLAARSRQNASGCSAPSWVMVVSLPTAALSCHWFGPPELPVAAIAVALAWLALSPLRTPSLPEQADRVCRGCNRSSANGPWHGADRWVAHKHGARVFGEARIWAWAVGFAVLFPSTWMVFSQRGGSALPAWQGAAMAISLFLGGASGRWLWRLSEYWRHRRRDSLRSAADEPLRAHAQVLFAGALSLQGLLAILLHGQQRLLVLAAWAVGFVWQVALASALQRGLLVSAFGGARSLGVGLGLGFALTVVWVASCGGWAFDPAAGAAGSGAAGSGAVGVVGR